jgi:hypothetical protein
VFRYADEDEVWVGGTNLLAEPTWRAIFLTGLGADPISEVLHAPGRLAIPILFAGVEEAAATFAE